MILFSNCKINIGLHITGKRQDGYHNLETLFYPVPLYDVIELIDANYTTITVLGLPIPGDPSTNIILKAWHLLKRDFPQLPPVHFYLLKNIPTGAGLGAGSANGAHTLKGLNDKFQLGLSTNQLIDYALQLGSDCPFFIINQPCFASGRGEILELIHLDLSDYQLLIVNPGIHIPTPWAFQQIMPQAPITNLKGVSKLPVSNWKGMITNDFEATATQAHPEIGSIKNELYQQGATFALMSGSGSTVYGLFHKKTTPTLYFTKDYFVKVINL